MVHNIDVTKEEGMTPLRKLGEDCLALLGLEEGSIGFVSLQAGDNRLWGRHTS
jgi:hypothetical protein